MAEHVIHFTRGTKPYIHGSVLELLTATCSCGDWSREIHRFDATSNPDNEQALADDHAVHAARLTSTVASWPADANDLHPLLAGQWHGDVTEGSEYRKLRVPLEAGGLAKGTTYVQLVEAIATEVRTAVDADGGNGVPLTLAPRLAAAKSLLQQLERNFPKVEAWRVMVHQPRDPHPIQGREPWCYLACHTREEAEAFAPVVLKHLNRDRRDPDSPYRYEATVDLGPTEIYRLQLPGVRPESKHF